MKCLYRGWFGGVICSTGTAMMAQDMHGSREAYIAHLQSSTGWIDLPWQIGFAIALCSAVWAFTGRDC